MDLATWLPFFLTTVVVSVSPGPGALAAMGAGLNHGYTQGRVIALGLALGVWTQLLVVGVGVGALLAASPSAFSLVKWAGAAYLVWLGLQQWRAQGSPVAASPPAASDEPGQTAGGQAGPSTKPLRRQLFLRGWTVNALNPKGTVFLIAVLPQFIDVHQALGGQYVVIGATFALVECTVMTAYVALASLVLRLLRSPAQIRWMNRGFGSVFMAAGLVLASFSRAA
jgi:homoserine/homoserine lactone efflux protein